jgi:hypothetical protein
MSPRVIFTAKICQLLVIREAKSKQIEFFYDAAEEEASRIWKFLLLPPSLNKARRGFSTRTISARWIFFSQIIETCPRSLLDVLNRFQYTSKNSLVLYFSSASPANVKWFKRFRHVRASERLEI